MKANGQDTCERAPDGSLFLECPIPKGWTARRARTSTSAEHPGAAVRWEAELFEVVEAAAKPDGGMRYRLEPWNPRHAVRVVHAYDESSEQQRLAEQMRRRGAIRLRGLSILLSPLAGLLPGPVQEKMEGDFGAPARAMTIASALPLFVVGALGFFSARIASMGGGIPFFPWLVHHPQVTLYLLAESGIRLAAVFLLGTPMGSLPGVLAYELWRKLARREPSPAAAPPAREARWKLADTYRMIEPLLALLSPEEQELLERRFGFEVLKWGRRSAVAVGIVAALNVVISLGMLAQGQDTFWDFLWLMAGGYLILEQIPRWRRIAQGHPAGSGLGALVRPMARRLLAPPL